MSIRSRVKAFEEAAAAASSYQRPTHPSPRTSLTFSSDDALTAASSSAPASPKPSSVLDDLDSFVFTGPPSSSPSPTSLSPRPNPPPILSKPQNITFRTASGTHTSPPRNHHPLISFSSPPKNSFVKELISGSAPVIPPLPPRRQPSTASLTSNASNVPPPLPRRSSPRGPTTTLSSLQGKRSDSLTIDHTFTSVTNSQSTRHAHASSTSSFQSLSLSDNDQDVFGLDEVDHKFPSAASRSDEALAKRGSESAPRKVPPVPQRPLIQHSSGSSNSSAQSLKKQPTFVPTPVVQQNVPYQVRRPAPAPPSRPSATSSTSKRPPPLNVTPNPLPSGPSGGRTPPARRKVPIPPPARMRYEALFDLNLRKTSTNSLLTPDSGSAQVASRPTRSRNGWRGPSIDFQTTGGSVNSVASHIGDKLHGQLVKQIWLCSKLDKAFLRQIWADCDSSKSGYLDRDAFVEGMWRIDEELARRAAKRKEPLARQPSSTTIRR
ncbi:hypothetical protein FRB99_007068 [Tulasnella sp. 403]|nr:hypothetical protein FRB99_007068 [Tulasnella sp. 403]